MKERLKVITGNNLQQAISKANSAGLTRENLISIIGMPNSGEFNIVYWEQYEQSNK